MLHVDDLVSRLFREIERDLGTVEMIKMSLSAFSDSLNEMEIKNVAQFKAKIKDFLLLLNDVKPKYAMLLDVFYKIWDKVDSLREGDDIISEVQSELHELQQEIEHNLYDLVENGETLVEDDDVIMIYNTSNTVLKVLRKAHNSGKRFKIIIAEQNNEKTRAIMDFLLEARIEFSSVPAYMASHMLDSVSKLFMGAVTFKSTHEFVMNTGSGGVVSQATSHKIPVYMFMVTSKFALWESTEHESAFKMTDIIEDKDNHEVCKRVRFSHDRVSLSHFDLIVTDTGVYNQRQLIDLYERRFAERKKKRDEVLGNKNS